MGVSGAEEGQERQAGDAGVVEGIASPVAEGARALVLESVRVPVALVGRLVLGQPFEALFHGFVGGAGPSGSWDTSTPPYSPATPGPARAAAEADGRVGLVAFARIVGDGLVFRLVLLGDGVLHDLVGIRFFDGLILDLFLLDVILLVVDELLYLLLVQTRFDPLPGIGGDVGEAHVADDQEHREVEHQRGEQPGRLLQVLEELLVEVELRGLPPWIHLRCVHVGTSIRTQPSRGPMSGGLNFASLQACRAQ